MSSCLKEDLIIIRLVPKDGPVPDYKAGQFITLGLPNPAEGGKIVRRAYSIASHPENRDYHRTCNQMGQKTTSRQINYPVI